MIKQSKRKKHHGQSYFWGWLHLLRFSAEEYRAQNMSNRTKKDRMTGKEYLKFKNSTKRRGKYNNRKVELDGHYKCQDKNVHF